jgi:hypothetical protein
MTSRGRAGLAVAALLGLMVMSPATAVAKKHHHPKERSPLFHRLAGHSLIRSAPNSDGSTFSERFNFCRKGGYSYRAGGGTGSGYFETSYHGRWRVASSAGNSGVVQYTVTAFVSLYADGTPASSFPGSPLAQPVTFGPFGVYFGGLLYSRGRAKC